MTNITFEEISALTDKHKEELVLIIRNAFEYNKGKEALIMRDLEIDSLFQKEKISICFEIKETISLGILKKISSVKNSNRCKIVFQDFPVSCSIKSNETIEKTVKRDMFIDLSRLNKPPEFKTTPRSAPKRFFESPAELDIKFGNDEISKWFWEKNADVYLAVYYKMLQLLNWTAPTEIETSIKELRKTTLDSMQNLLNKMLSHLEHWESPEEIRKQIAEQLRIASFIMGEDVSIVRLSDLFQLFNIHKS